MREQYVLQVQVKIILQNKDTLENNFFVLGIPKLLWEDIDTLFGEKKVHRGIRNQKSWSFSYGSS